ncbi:unnamed protein product, partial [Didymodactylos carnosus]
TDEQTVGLTGEFLLLYQMLNKKIDFVDKKIDFVDKKIDFVDKQINFLNNKIDYLDTKVNQFDRKINCIYEKLAIERIVKTLESKHEITFDIVNYPTNRVFSSKTKNMKQFFSDFAARMEEKYKLWTNYPQLVLSRKPAQLEFDMIGFGYKRLSNKQTPTSDNQFTTSTKHKTKLITSPVFAEDYQRPSSLTYINRFKQSRVNHLLVLEATTSNVDFDEQILPMFMQQTSTACNSDIFYRMRTYLHKLLQLERQLYFLFQYYYPLNMEQVFAYLSLFQYNMNDINPTTILEKVLKSDFQECIPLINELHTKKRFFIIY